MIPTLVLKAGKDKAVKRFHPWIFSGAIKNIKGRPEEGGLVEVLNNSSDFLGIGHYHDASIAVRIISFEKVEINQEFWLSKLKEAWKLRQQLGLTLNPSTNCFRLINGEGDGFSGLIADWYSGILVLQAHSVGMHKAFPDLINAAKELLGDQLKGIYSKSVKTLPKNYAATIEDGYLYGSASDGLVLENDMQFKVSWEQGQKTGFFLDQRDNRALLKQYSKGKKVLNAFCYSGGFSISALKGGAKLVHSVDVSEKATDLAKDNLQLNGYDETKHEVYTFDVLKFLKENSNMYDVMVLDPPAYAKNIKARHRALQGYRRLNAEGMKHIKDDGILFTFSCSQVVDQQLFYNTVVAAALDAKRKVRVLHQLRQPADHPVNFFHTEGHYLKGLVLHISR